MHAATTLCLRLNDQIAGLQALVDHRLDCLSGLVLPRGLGRKVDDLIGDILADSLHRGEQRADGFSRTGRRLGQQSMVLFYTAINRGRKTVLLCAKILEWKFQQPGAVDHPLALV